jgi:hypothetical protein
VIGPRSDFSGQSWGSSLPGLCPVVGGSTCQGVVPSQAFSDAFVVLAEP